MPKKLTALLKRASVELFRINDTPHKIAQGLGIGVFTGIMPGIGPAAALLLSIIFRANRASAILGSLLTNTWLSFVTLVLSIKIGSAILGISWREIHNSWSLFLKAFKFADLFKSSILKIIFPVIIGYIVVAFCLGLIAYLITLIIAALIKIKYKNRSSPYAKILVFPRAGFLKRRSRKEP